MVAEMTRCFGIASLPAAEDAVQEALLEALRRWPFEGTPREPAAWLRTVARRKLLDVLRRAAAFDAKVAPEASRVAEDADGAEDDLLLREPFLLQDDVLGLLFACCTPSLGRDTAVALTLSVVAGFTAREVAQAFLVSETAMAERLVRAKQRLRDSGVSVAVPSDATELATRLPQILDVLYLMFNEGYVATEGDALMREALCGEATRLALLLSHEPTIRTPEVHALAALLLFQLARFTSRMEPDGGVIPLAAQDRSVWDASHISAGFREFERAASGDRMTSFHLQAEIASHHVLAPTYDATKWDAIVRAYDALLSCEPTLVVRVNRAVALGERDGPSAALAALEEAESDPSARGYRWFYTVRAHFRAKAGSVEGARDDLQRAATLTRSRPMLRWLEERHAALLDSSA